MRYLPGENDVHSNDQETCKVHTIRRPSPGASAGDSFRGSAQYWEKRYRKGGNSGAGSYNRLAEFKSSFLNDFVKRNEVGSVLELGCGDGAQLKLARYPQYTGVDVAQSAVNLCRSLFQGDPSKSFYLSGELAADRTAELSLSLDVIYHLVEDTTFDAYMSELFSRARRFVIIYSSNRQADGASKHVRHREFTAWVERNQPQWRLEATVKNAYPWDPANPDQTSFADFYVFAIRQPAARA